MTFGRAEDAPVDTEFDEGITRCWFNKVGINISISDIKRSTFICDSVGGRSALILLICVSVSDVSNTDGRGALEYRLSNEKGDKAYSGMIEATGVLPSPGVRRDRGVSSGYKTMITRKNKLESSARTRKLWSTLKLLVICRVNDDPVEEFEWCIFFFSSANDKFESCLEWISHRSRCSHTKTYLSSRSDADK